MRLLRARISDFRNIEQCEITPGPRATLLVGQNGQGKTNTIEALYYAATLKPLRASRLSELVRFGADRAEVSATYELPGGPREFSVAIESGERQVSVDGKRVAGLDDYFGQVVAVSFAPDDLVLVKGPPENRRRFLDRTVFERFPAYLREARDYGSALKARNRLLRDGGDKAVREAFDAQLMRTGARVWRRRLDLIAELEPHTARAFAAVARLPDPIEIRYRPHAMSLESTWSEEDLSRAFGEVLDEKLELDRERGFTSVGPHADDVAIGIGNRPARSYASQGQQRAIVLALKIGEIENLRAHLDSYPLLLLDDVSSELDPERNGFLMDYLRNLDTQFVLSTTDASLVSTAAGADAVRYDVSAGAATLAPA